MKNPVKKSNAYTVRDADRQPFPDFSFKSYSRSYYAHNQTDKRKSDLGIKIYSVNRSIVSFGLNLFDIVKKFIKTHFFRFFNYPL